MAQCIICGNENHATSVEHIVPESLGNKWYLMQPSKICDACNRRFSAFERPALSNSVLLMERARYGIANKRGKPVSGEVQGLEITGNEKFEKQLISVKGLTEENLVDFNPETGTWKLIVPAFDKSAVPTSRLLLKMGIESLYTSRRNIFNQFDFADLKVYLLGQSNTDWPFLGTNLELSKFESIPRFADKHKFSQINCQLRYSNINSGTLLFKFQYGEISYVINLADRSLDWIPAYVEAETHQDLIYPIHYRRKVENFIAVSKK